MKTKFYLNNEEIFQFKSNEKDYIQTIKNGNLVFEEVFHFESSSGEVLTFPIQNFEEKLISKDLIELHLTAKNCFVNNGKLCFEEDAKND